MVYPTLSRKRLSKALIFSKAEYGLRETKYKKELKQSLVGIAKYQSLWLSGGWFDPAIRELLPAMHTRDAIEIQNQIDQVECEKLLVELLQEDGYVVPPDATLA